MVSRLRNSFRMGNEDSNYKRIEDEKWRESVSTRLVSLTDSEVTQNDRLDDVDEEIHTIKEILEGKTSEKDDNGIKGDIHDLSVRVNELQRLMMPDHLGQGGVIARLKAVERKAGIEEHESDNRWKFKTAVVGIIGAAIVALLSNFDRIAPSLKKLWTRETVSISKTPKKHTARTSKRRPRPVTEANDGPQEDLSDGRSGDGDDTK